MANERTQQLIDQLRKMGNRDFRSFQAASPGYEASLDRGGKAMPVRDVMASARDISQSVGRSSVMPTMDGTLPNASPTPGNVASAAQFTVQVKRLTADIASALPVMIFDPIDRANGYRQALQGRMPATVTLSKVEGGEAASLPNAWQFTYDDGAKQDVVEVTCTTAPYPAFLDALQTDMFELVKIRLSLSDPSQLSQFNEELLFWSKSMFGLGATNPVVPENFRSPQQYQAGIVDIDVNAKFDKQTGIILPIIPVAGLVVSLNCYAPRFYQHAARFW